MGLVSVNLIARDPRWRIVNRLTMCTNLQGRRSAEEPQSLGIRLLLHLLASVFQNLQKISTNFIHTSDDYSGSLVPDEVFLKALPVNTNYAGHRIGKSFACFPTALPWDTYVCQASIQKHMMRSQNTRYFYLGRAG